MNIQEIKATKAKMVNENLDKHRVFFAFSDSQLAEGKKKINFQEGEKLVHIGHGGYMPKSLVDGFIKGMEEANQWFKDQIKANDQRRAHIAYELANHECYYTGDIDSAVSALGDDYTFDEVHEVYIQERQNVDY